MDRQKSPDTGLGAQEREPQMSERELLSVLHPNVGALYERLPHEAKRPLIWVYETVRHIKPDLVGRWVILRSGKFVEIFDRKIDSFNRQIQDLEGRREKLQRLLEDYQAGRIPGSTREKERRMKEISKTIENINARIQEFNEKVQTITTKKEQFEAAREGVARRLITRYEGRINPLQEKRKHLEDDLTQLETEMATYQARLNEYGATLESIAAEKEELRRRLEEMGERVEGEDEKLYRKIEKEFQKARKEIERELARLRKRRETIRREIEKIDRRINPYLNKLERIKALMEGGKAPEEQRRAEEEQTAASIEVPFEVAFEELLNALKELAAYSSSDSKLFEDMKSFGDIHKNPTEFENKVGELIKTFYELSGRSPHESINLEEFFHYIEEVFQVMQRREGDPDKRERINALIKNLNTIKRKIKYGFEQRAKPSQGQNNP